jgi:PAS domain S-box-containing protein
MPSPLRILVLEDLVTDYELMLRELRKAGLDFTARRVETESDFRQQLQEFAPDLVLADYSLPGYDGFSALELARRERPQVPFIFVSGTMGEENAIEALQRGAIDYVLKQRFARLGPSARRALAEAQVNAQRRRVEDELRASEERFRSVAQTASDAIISVDGHGRIVFWNSAAERIFGYASLEVDGQPLSIIVPQRLRRQDAAGLEGLLAPGTVQVGGPATEAIGLRQNGSEFPIELSMASWHSGPHRFFTGIIRDISQRKQAEAERERLILQLQTALADVKTLSGIIPICAGCKKIRDDKGFWNQVDTYIQTHSLAKFTHGLCPDCTTRLYPEIDEDMK